MPMVAVRYDLRRPSFAASHPDLYRTALDQCVWADEVGLDTVVLSEHHGTDDGYLPSPLVFAAAVAGRTERIGITIAALLVPLHDPLAMAEDLAGKDVVLGSIHVDADDPKALGKTVRSMRVKFPVGTLADDAGKTLFAWGVRGLPWLILTDREHVVRAEGFALNALDEKLKEINTGRE